MTEVQRIEKQARRVDGLDGWAEDPTKLTTGPLFTERYDVLPPNLVESRSREIGCYNDRIALKFDRHLGSPAA